MAVVCLLPRLSYNRNRQRARIQVVAVQPIRAGKSSRVICPAYRKHQLSPWSLLFKVNRIVRSLYRQAGYRQKLLERIQRPERIPVEPQTQILAPLKTDGNELAKLGAIFPEDEE